MQGLADNFDTYFRIRYANASALKSAAYRIRYQVYVEEMGWEPPNESGLETDPCDDYAHLFLLEHRRTQAFAGCVRLVIPPPSNRLALLPFEHHQIPCSRARHLDPKRMDRGRFGEISRLAVPASFRRRQNERHRPFVLDEYSSTGIYTAEERRSFPNIAIGLYLASIAMVELQELDGVYVVMEPKLERHLQRFGLPFTRISDALQLRGSRALFCLPKADLCRHMPAHIAELYELIKSTLKQQLLPYHLAC